MRWGGWFIVMGVNYVDTCVLGPIGTVQFAEEIMWYKMSIISQESWRNHASCCIEHIHQLFLSFGKDHV